MKWSIWNKYNEKINIVNIELTAIILRSKIRRCRKQEKEQRDQGSIISWNKTIFPYSASIVTNNIEELISN